MVCNLLLRSQNKDHPLSSPPPRWQCQPAQPYKPARVSSPRPVSSVLAASRLSHTQLAGINASDPNQFFDLTGPERPHRASQASKRRQSTSKHCEPPSRPATPLRRPANPPAAALQPESYPPQSQVASRRAPNFPPPCPDSALFHSLLAAQPARRQPTASLAPPRSHPRCTRTTRTHPSLAVPRTACCPPPSLPFPSLLNPLPEFCPRTIPL